MFGGLPGGIVLKNLPANKGDSKDVGLIPESGKGEKEKRKWQSTPVVLPGKSHGQMNLAGL